MMRRGLVLAVLLFTGVACGDGGSPVATSSPTVAPAPAPTTPPAEARVRFGEAAVSVEVVHDDPGRQRGLMHRESLGADGGMLFLFPGPNEGGFWMKNTLIPLSIAYMGSVGGSKRSYEVLAIMDMEPCRADPCPGYDPGMPYDAALEVNQGWYDRNGVSTGSRAEVEGDLPTPS